MYVKYIGKKLPFKFNSPLIKTVIDVRPDQLIFEMPKHEFELITKHNPTGFLEEIKVERLSTKAILPTKFPAVEEKEEVENEESDLFVCDKCGKTYKSWHKRHYENHIKKCGVDDDEAEVE